MNTGTSVEKYLYFSVPSSGCPCCCSHCLVITTNYRALEKQTVIVWEVSIRENSPFARNTLKISDIVTLFMKYGEENNTVKNYLVNSAFIAKNPPRKYFQTHEGWESDCE